MRIPHNLLSSSEDASFAKEASDSPETWISVAEASALLKIRPSAVVGRIAAGKLEGKRHPDLPFTYDGKENYVVLLECLPQKLQLRYHVSRLPPKEHISADLVSPRSAFGDAWLLQFINVAQLLRDAALIRQKYHGTGRVTQELARLAGSYHISLSTLYRFEGQLQARQVSLLYTDPVYLQDRLPKTMCLWSCDLAFALYLHDEKHYSQNDIMEELGKKSGIECGQCPYRPDREKDFHAKAGKRSKDCDDPAPVCAKSEGHMVVPRNRKALNRLLSHIPPQLTCFRRRGYREWRAKYGLFSMRQGPLLVFDSFQGDHHVFDCFVRVPIYRYKNDRKYMTEIAVRPVLTAWMDSASGYIVGWVISILPNSDTIAEAFCRACVPTVGDMAFGLPCTVIIDCGKDYRSRLLQDDCTDPYILENWDESCLNRRFAGLGLFPALGIDIQECLPYHPQSKPIERAFGTIERKFISKLPGWCHNSVAERPDGFGKRLKEMLDKKVLLTLEQFVVKFETEILPGYHGISDVPVTLDEAPEWVLTIESMSPAQRYRTLEKARNATPDWQTMGILKRHYYPDCTKIEHFGVRFQNQYYQDDAMKNHVGERVSILSYAVSKPYSPSSIGVMLNNKFLCEAFPIRKHDMSGESSAVLQEISEMQRTAKNVLTEAIQRISRSAEAIMPDDKMPPIPSQKDQLREMAYGQTPEDSPAPSSDIPLQELSVDMQNGTASAAPSHALYRGSKASYDKAYDALFGS